MRNFLTLIEISIQIYQIPNKFIDGNRIPIELNQWESNSHQWEIDFHRFNSMGNRFPSPNSTSRPFGRPQYGVAEDTECGSGLAEAVV